MRFEVREPASDENVNVSQVHPLRELLVLSLRILTGGVLILLLLGWLSEQIVLRLPIPAEIRSFEALSLHVSELDPPGHPRLKQSQALLDRLVLRLEEASRLDSHSFPKIHLRLHSSSEPNAFAVPGGVVMVTSGLLSSVASENELAFVLGHELGHFKNRDHLRRLSRVMVLQLGLYALVGKAASFDAGTLANLMERITSSSLDRSQEYAADEWGLQLLYLEYGHVNGATHFFEALQEHPLSQLSSWLSTHPAGDRRIQRLRSLATERGWPLEGELRPMQP